MSIKNSLSLVSWQERASAAEAGAAAAAATAAAAPKEVDASTQKQLDVVAPHPHLVDIRPPGKGNSNSHGARLVY